jgi:hypothetical protein
MAYLDKIMEANNNPEWHKNLNVIADPIPHISEKEIMKVMPDSLKQAWDDFMYGQTCLLCEDGGAGIYPQDFGRFIGKLKKNQPLVDTIEEWD